MRCNRSRLAFGSFGAALALDLRRVATSQPCVWIGNHFHFVLYLVSSDTHEAECVSSVRRPVVLGTKTNLALLVFLLVIPANGLDAWLCRFFVEPDRREHAPSDLDAVLRSALALVRHHLNAVASVSQRRLVRHVVNLVMRVAVVR